MKPSIVALLAAAILSLGPRCVSTPAPEMDARQQADTRPDLPRDSSVLDAPSSDGNLPRPIIESVIPTPMLNSPLSIDDRVMINAIAQMSDGAQEEMNSLPLNG